MIVTVINKDCYQVEGLATNKMFVTRIFHPELFLAITIAVVNKYGWQK